MFESDDKQRINFELAVFQGTQDDRVYKSARSGIDKSFVKAVD